MSYWSIYARHAVMCVGLLGPALLVPRAVLAADGSYKSVELPELPDGALCAADKRSLLGQTSAATMAAAENAQIAAKRLSEQQAAGTADAATLTAARKERDERMDAWRKAESTLDAVAARAEKPCPAPADTAAKPAAAPATTTAAIAPAAPVSGAANLAVSVVLPPTCKPGAVCQVTVDIENKGSEPMPSPMLASLSLGLEGGSLGAMPSGPWECKQGGENITCASTGIALQPQTRTRMTLDWTLPKEVRRAQVNACARIVWAARGADGVYRAEQIAAVQHALERAGFDAGGVSGRMTPKTLEAIGQLRQQAGIAGASGITPDLLANLFGANAALAGDSSAGDDSACANAGIEGAQIASAPAPAKVAKPAPPKKPKPKPRPADVVEDEDEEIIRAPAPRRRAAPPVIEDDEDEVIVYRSPGARYGETRYGNARMVYGPEGPVLVYPDGSYRRIETRPRYYQR